MYDYHLDTLCVCVYIYFKSTPSHVHATKLRLGSDKYKHKWATVDHCEPCKVQTDPSVHPTKLKFNPFSSFFGSYLLAMRRPDVTEQGVKLLNLLNFQILCLY